MEIMALQMKKRRMKTNTRSSKEEEEELIIGEEEVEAKVEEIRVMVEVEITTITATIGEDGEDTEKTARRYKTDLGR